MTFKTLKYLQDVEFDPILLEKVMSAFDQMSKNDQEEYLKLYNSFDHIQSLPAQKHADLKEDLEMRRKILNSIEGCLFSKCISHCGFKF